MKFEFSIYPIRKLARAAGDAALDAASALHEGSSAAGRRVGEILSRIRLEREVRDLREEINLQMRELGEIMYASHRGRPAGQGQADEIMEYVDGLHEELDAPRKEKETLSGRIVCPACGEANRADCLYCRNCGEALGRQ